MISIRRTDLWRIGLRSLLIQGSWNPERMLALGFCFALIPVLRRLNLSGGDRSEFLKRHLAFFNAHPFTTSWVLGAVARLEQDAANQQWLEDRPIERFKERLYGPMGNIGDRLFWKLIKPIVAMIGVITTIFLGAIGVIIFLLVYNLPHLVFRWYALTQGFSEGFDLVRRISMRRFQKTFARLSLAGSCLVGVLIASALYWSASIDLVAAMVFLFSAGISLLLLLRTRFSISLLLFLLLLASVIVGTLAG